MEAEKSPISLKLLLTLFEWSHFDLGILVACNDRILAEVAKTDEPDRVAMRAALERSSELLISADCHPIHNRVTS
jgi:hypothetical protein